MVDPGDWVCAEEEVERDRWEWERWREQAHEDINYSQEHELPGTLSSLVDATRAWVVQLGRQKVGRPPLEPSSAKVFAELEVLAVHCMAAMSRYAEAALSAEDPEAIIAVVELLADVAKARTQAIAELRRGEAGTTLKECVLHQSKFFYEGAWHDALIYDRDKLHEGLEVAGPAIVSEMDSTTVVLPDYKANVDNIGNLLINPIV